MSLNQLLNGSRKPYLDLHADSIDVRAFTSNGDFFVRNEQRITAVAGPNAVNENQVITVIDSTTPGATLTINGAPVADDGQIKIIYNEGQTNVGPTTAAALNADGFATLQLNGGAGISSSATLWFDGTAGAWRLINARNCTVA